ncbi:protein boule-like isoform X7 [Tachypleus tridentatus]|uniref:protein boule-like isoform X7 n=1 Tax=Tachypleus tridentatus TaxID=6853 RepID=UPI003FD13ED3
MQLERPCDVEALYLLKSSDPSCDRSPSPSPVGGLNAPKFGTLVPNRVFVGGIDPSTTEAELYALFSNYGNVKATKLIADRAGVSKGYGFVTFETEEEARRMQTEADNLVLKDRKLNIAPAIKKQPFGRMYNESVQLVPNGTIIYQNGVPCTYHNGMAFYSPPDSLYQLPQQQAACSLVYGQPVYLPPQQYQHQPTMSPQWAASNTWRLTPQTSSVSGQFLHSSVPPVTTTPTSSEVYHYHAIPQHAYTLTSPTKSPVVQLSPYGEYVDIAVLESECEGSRTTSIKKATDPGQVGFFSSNTKCHCSGDGTARRHHLVPKIVNGVTVMAYPTSVVFTTPPPISAKASGDCETVTMATVGEVGFI